METCQGAPVAFHEVNNVHLYDAPRTSELTHVASFIRGVVGGGKYGVTNYLSDPCSTTEKVVELCPASLARSQRRRMKGGYSRSQPSPSVEQGLQSMLLLLKEVVPLG